MSKLPHSIETSPGLAALLDYRLTVWRQDYAEIMVEVAAKHLNRSGVLHGGVTATLIDAACGYSGVHSADPAHVRRTVTLSMTVNFIGQVDRGQILTAKANRIGGGRQIFFSRCDVVDETGRLVATGEGTFRYRQGSEHPA